MTDLLTIVLLCLALLLVLFLAMPMAVVLYWMEETFPGLVENLKFWGVVVGAVGAALLLGQYLLSFA